MLVIKGAEVRYSEKHCGCGRKVRFSYRSIHIIEPAQTTQGLTYAMIEDLAIVAFPSVIMGFVERPPFDNIGSREALEYGNKRDEDDECE